MINLVALVMKSCQDPFNCPSGTRKITCNNKWMIKRLLWLKISLFEKSDLENDSLKSEEFKCAKKSNSFFQRFSINFVSMTIKSRRLYTALPRPPPPSTALYSTDTVWKKATIEWHIFPEGLKSLSTHWLTQPRPLLRKFLHADKAVAWRLSNTATKSANAAFFFHPRSDWVENSTESRESQSHLSVAKQIVSRGETQQQSRPI